MNAQKTFLECHLFSHNWVSPFFPHNSLINLTCVFYASLISTSPFSCLFLSFHCKILQRQACLSPAFTVLSIIIIDVSGVDQFVKPEPVLNYLSLDRHFLLIREEYDTAKEELGGYSVNPHKALDKIEILWFAGF